MFERLQIEGVNGNRYQENIIIDTKNHNKINGKTMLDLCSTRDAKNVGKGPKIETEMNQKNDELHAKMHWKNKAQACRTNIEKHSKNWQAQLPNPPLPSSLFAMLAAFAPTEALDCSSPASVICLIHPKAMQT